MIEEEEFEVLRQNGWRWRKLDDEFFLIEAPAHYAGQEFSTGSLSASAKEIHSPLFGDLPLIAGDNPSAFAGHLVDYTARHNLSQAELAVHLGCSVEALQDVFYAPLPQPDTVEDDLERTARETGCRVAALQRVIDEQKRPPMQWLYDGGKP